MKVFKKIAMGITIMALLASLALASVGCGKTDTDLKGVTDTTIYVGNTAGTTGVLSAIGGPFNTGIKAAFADYNAKGGYTGLDEAGNQIETGLKIELKHYDDGGKATDSATLTETLLYEDEVFAIVGNFAANCVEANLEVIKEAKAPMVYAAAGNNALFSENATGADRGIFPVQPLNNTEGKMLIQRAFASAENGGLAATKVGVVYGTDEASTAAFAGIEAEKANLSDAQKSAIVPQQVQDATTYSTAVNALKEANCDVVIIVLTGDYYTAFLKAMATAEYKTKVLTSYNNSSAATFNGTNNLMKDEFVDIFQNVIIYALGWLDISAPAAGEGAYYLNDETSPLYQIYKAAGSLPYFEGLGVIGFNQEYWDVAHSIYNYVFAGDVNNITDAFQMSYNSYALAGYIAGDLFCQGLEALKAEGKALTRANFIDAMENKESFKVSMGDTISFQNGKRAGVEVFAMSSIVDLFDPTAEVSAHVAYASTVSGLYSLEDYRALIAG